MTINSSGQLDLNGYSTGIGSLTMTGGSVTTGAGTLTLGGTLTGNASSSTATISGNLALGANRIFSIADGAASTDMDVSAAISGAFTVTKNGAGTLSLSGNNSFTGALSIDAGTVLLGNNNRIADTANLTLNSGTFNTGGYSDTLGTLTLSANSIINFGSGASVIHFGDSSGVSWAPGTTLIITNWSGPYAGGGTDQLFFGSGITGLTGSQLGKIEFTDNLGHRQLANILSTGEVVPIPEPATWAGLALLGLGVGLHERRRVVGWFPGLRWGCGVRVAKIRS